MSKIFFISLLFLWATTFLQAQDLQKLQQENDSLKYKLEILEHKYGISYEKNIAAERKFWEVEARDFMSNVNRQNWVIGVISVLFGTFTILGLITAVGTVWTYKSVLEKQLTKDLTEIKENFTQKYDEEIEKKIKELFYSKSHTVEYLIKEHEEDDALVKNTKILIVSKTKKESEDLKDFIAKYGFESQNLTAITAEKSLKSLDKEDFSLVLLNNESGAFNTQNAQGHFVVSSELHHYLEDSDKWSYLYFGSVRFDSKLEYSKSNFTNSRFTLFEQILNTLKTVDKLKKSKIS